MEVMNGSLAQLRSIISSGVLQHTSTPVCLPPVLGILPALGIFQLASNKDRLSAQEVTLANSSSVATWWWASLATASFLFSRISHVACVVRPSKNSHSPRPALFSRLVNFLTLGVHTGQVKTGTFQSKTRDCFADTENDRWGLTPVMTNPPPL